MVDLATLSPGPALAAALETLDPSVLGGHQLVDALVGFRTQIAHLEAGFHTVLAELLRSPADAVDALPDRVPVPDDVHAGDVAVGVMEMALGWSRVRCHHAVAHAWQLVDDYPTTLGLLSRGVIEASIARLIPDRLAVLEHHDHRAAVEAMVTGWIVAAYTSHGVRKTYSQVNKRLTGEIYRIDPAGAETRHRKTIADRDVYVLPSPNADDTAAVLLSHLGT